MQIKQGKPEEVVEVEGFDLKTHYFDRKSKRLSHVNPYRLHVLKGAQYFERPVGSGNVYTEDGEAAGWIDLSTMKHDLKADHKEWIPPMTAEQKEQAEVQAVLSKSAELQRELELIKKENERLQKAAKAKSGDSNGNGTKNISGAKPNVGGYSPSA